jgi:hypothetical protein
MPPEEIAIVLDKRPFVPFRVYLSDGTVYEVRHPELLLLGRRSAHIGLASKADGQTLPTDRVATFSLLHVVRLEPISATSSLEI